MDAVVTDEAFANARAEVIARRARGMALVICGIWVPMAIFTDPMMFGHPFVGLWVRVPTGIAILLLRY
jgi:hypothetical protein